jgi:hydroxypyruvate isomerase
MDRRDFFAASAAVGAGALAGKALAGENASAAAGPFSMKFAPHFGMFRHLAGDDPVAQLEYAHDQGFTAWEDNGMGGRPVEEQTRISKAMERLGMEMGVFVLNPSTAWKPTFSRNDQGDRDAFIGEAHAAVEVAKRVNAKWATVVLGSRHPRIDLSYQTAYAVDQLRRAADILEPVGLVMVLEPLNPRDHPNMLLAEMGHAYEICRAVDSPSCKILCDLYHQQVTEGNLIPNIDRSWDEIGYFQIGDNPGRKEPTTGEINYRKVFEHIKRKGFAGVLGMEHGLSGSGEDGERALIEAYRAVDPA